MGWRGPDWHWYTDLGGLSPTYLFDKFIAFIMCSGEKKPNPCLVMATFLLFNCTSCIEIGLHKEEQAEEIKTIQAVPCAVMCRKPKDCITRVMGLQKKSYKLSSAPWLYNKSNQGRFLIGPNGKENSAIFNNFILKSHLRSKLAENLRLNNFYQMICWHDFLISAVACLEQKSGFCFEHV